MRKAIIRDQGSRFNVQRYINLITKVVIMIAWKQLPGPKTFNYPYATIVCEEAPANARLKTPMNVNYVMVDVTAVTKTERVGCVSVTVSVKTKKRRGIAMIVALVAIPWYPN